MNLMEGSIVNLSNQQSYFVVKIINFNNQDFLYLVSTTNKEQLGYFLWNKTTNDIDLVTDGELIKNLSVELLKQVNEKS